MPVDENAPAIMARLEKAAATPGAGLAGLADLGGKVTDLDWKTFDELQAMRAKLPVLISQTDAGNLTPPYRHGSDIEIAAVHEKEPAQPIPLTGIRERVATAYAEQYKAQLYAQLLDEWVPLDKLEFFEAGLARLLQKDLAEADITPEQLDDLLGELGSTP